MMLFGQAGRQPTSRICSKRRHVALQPQLLTWFGGTDIHLKYAYSAIDRWQSMLTRTATTTTTPQCRALG